MENLFEDLCLQTQPHRSYSIQCPAPHEPMENLFEDLCLQTQPHRSYSIQCPGIEVELGNVRVKSGEEITLSCKATSDSDVSAIWMKETQILENGGRINISQRRRLFTHRICDAKEEDAGQYTVHLSNAYGKVSAISMVQIIGDKLYNHGWRRTERNKNMEIKWSLREFRPSNPEAKHLRFLLYGPVGAGKSSIINSIKGIFSNRPVTQALTSAGASRSFTKKYTSFEIVDQERRVLPFVFCDIMGLVNEEGGALTPDIISALKGHVKDGYKFHPTSPLTERDFGYNSSPTLNDKVHCLVNVVPANKISLYLEMDPILLKMREVREAATELDIPQVVFLTHVDEACPYVRKDLRNVYKSKKIKEKMLQCSNQLGIPMNLIFPVKNYHEETDMDEDVNTLFLSALKNIVYFADDYIACRRAITF